MVFEHRQKGITGPERNKPGLNAEKKKNKKKKKKKQTKQGLGFRQIRHCNIYFTCSRG
jgi:hypothetical protein